MPNEQLEFYIRFNAAWESAVFIYDQNTGGVLFQTNNSSAEAKIYRPPVSAAGTSRVFGVFGFHKDSPPNPRKHWYFSTPRILDDSASLRIVGFEDQAGDGDFNDAVVEIRFRSN